jgi:hypothetical protein
VIELFGHPYLVERECAGLWAYGGYYVCNRVIKLTVKKLAADKQTVPVLSVCQSAKEISQRTWQHWGMQTTSSRLPCDRIVRGKTRQSWRFGKAEISKGRQ